MNLLLLGIHDLAQYESCGDRKDDVADEFFISRALLGGDDSVADDVRAPDCVWERERDPNLSEAFHTSLSCLEIINISSLQLEADTMLLRTKESLINWKILEIALQHWSWNRLILLISFYFMNFLLSLKILPVEKPGRIISFECDERYQINFCVV